MRPLPAAVAAAILLLSGAAPAQQATPGSIFTNRARTYYEAIDFSTPESSAKAFLAAWARRDYPTVNVILTQEAQWGWSVQTNTPIGLKTLLPREADAALKVSIYGSDGQQWHEILFDNNLVFDNLMRSAERFDALPFTIGADARITRSNVDGNVATVTVETAGQPPMLDLKLVHIPSGRWKVDQVVLPDADPALKPWGFKARE